MLETKEFWNEKMLGPHKYEVQKRLGVRVQKNLQKFCAKKITKKKFVFNFSLKYACIYEQYLKGLLRFPLVRPR